MVRLKWLGHAAWQLEVDGKNVLIDPFITNNPAAPVKLDELGKVDVVIVTHDHFDHVGDAFEICRRNDALFVALYELKVKAEQNGVKRTMGANIGGTFTADGLRLTFVPAVHTGNPSGVVIHGSDATVYHAGDTGLFGDMKLIGQLYKPDVALLPIGSLFTMGPQEAAVAAALIKPKVVIPMHYNTFDAIRQDPKQYERLVRAKAKGVKVVVLNPGESFEYRRKGAKKA
ncbi:MAG: metal-dependent hydrolase [Nitrososphaerota archaeon]|nr:metal-dependent hydrolase [Candidatus Calditenuis fumarioli]